MIHGFLGLGYLVFGIGFGGFGPNTQNPKPNTYLIKNRRRPHPPAYRADDSHPSAA
jgi:hypothetical protein